MSMKGKMLEMFDGSSVILMLVVYNDSIIQVIKKANFGTEIILESTPSIHIKTNSCF